MARRREFSGNEVMRRLLEVETDYFIDEDAIKNEKLSPAKLYGLLDELGRDLEGIYIIYLQPYKLAVINENTREQISQAYKRLAIRIGNDRRGRLGLPLYIRWPEYSRN